MKLNRPLLVAIAFFALIFSVNAQSNNQSQPLPVIQYKANVDSPLTSIERRQLEEVYGNKLNSYILSKPQRLKAIKNILRNRIEIVEFSDPRDQKESQLLSEVSLFNYYVPELKRDLVFNKNTFNPLKYNFSFYSRGASMYRVDNTNYFILIKPQHQH